MVAVIVVVAAGTRWTWPVFQSYSSSAGFHNFLLF